MNETGHVRGINGGKRSNYPLRRQLLWRRRRSESLLHGREPAASFLSHLLHHQRDQCFIPWIIASRNPFTARTKTRGEHAEIWLKSRSIARTPGTARAHQENETPNLLGSSKRDGARDSPTSDSTGPKRLCSTPRNAGGEFTRPRRRRRSR